MSSNQRYMQLGGNLIIRRAEPEDSGKYVCYVNNTVADERVDTELLVAGKSHADYVYIFVLLTNFYLNFITVYCNVFYQ